MKEAAILAFGSILDSNNCDKLLAHVTQSIESLCGFILDPQMSRSLKETTAWTLSKISEIYGDQIEPSIFHGFYLTLIQLIGMEKKKVSIFLCNSLVHLSKKHKVDEGQISNLLSRHTEKVLAMLISLAYRKDAYDFDNNLAINAFFTMGIVIENAAPDTREVINRFFLKLVELLMLSFEPKHFQSQNMMRDYQDYICSTIDPCLISGYVKADSNIATSLIDAVIKIFNERNTVTEEGLMLASSVATSIGENFQPFLGIIGPYLTHGLKAINETSLCRVAIHSLSDIIRAVGDSFSQHIMSALPLVIEILKDPEADKSLKPLSFNVIADIFVTCKSNCLNYLQEIMFILGSAAEAACVIPEDKEDIEFIEYLEYLRETLVECLTCIFHTLRDLKQMKEFQIYTEPIIKFINRINSPEYNTTTVSRSMFIYY